MIFCQIKDDTDLFVIDEVGKMELYSSSFLPAVIRLLNTNVPLLATIPIAKYGRDIPGGIVTCDLFFTNSYECERILNNQTCAVARLRNHPGATIYTLYPHNRDLYRERVYSHVVDLLRKH